MRLPWAAAAAAWLALPGAGSAATPPAPTSASKPASSSPSKPAVTSPSKPPAAAPGRTAAARTPARSPAEQARNARSLEDQGAYAQAAQALRLLRRQLKPDVDLELFLALDEARAGHLDSAAARLARPLIEAASTDSMPVRRRQDYNYRRELQWLNGHFDGWHWYILRARAEIAARRGLWAEARTHARAAVEARPLSGKDWLILAVCAGRAGGEEEARQAAEQAVLLDPTLPEAHYLSGLWAWRDGRRAEATGRFRRAVELDSGYLAPALAMVRLRLPGAPPDTLPTELLGGTRRVGLLTSPAGPKSEEFGEVDTPAALLSAPDSAVVEHLRAGVKPLQLVLSVLVDEEGRAVLNEVPWFDPGQLDFRKVVRILSQIPSWRFRPATRTGQPRRVWLAMQYFLNP